MRKMIYLMVCTFIILCKLNAQSTYYWVGGTGGAWGTGTSWNKKLDGSGASRTSNNADTLIIDGTNIGGASPATGTVTPSSFTSATIGQLKLQNGASVVFQRASPSSSGTTTLTIAGDGAATDDLTIDGTSTLTLSSSAASYSFNLTLSSTATANISGTLNINDNGNTSAKAFLTAATAGSIVFANGSKCTVNNTSSSDYPFGSPTYTPVIFQSGSTLVYKGVIRHLPLLPHYSHSVFQAVVLLK